MTPETISGSYLLIGRQCGIPARQKGKDMSKVFNCKGQEIDFEAAVALMDDDLREMLADGAPESEQWFLQIYADNHFAKFGEKFAPWSGGAW